MYSHTLKGWLPDPYQFKTACCPNHLFAGTPFHSLLNLAFYPHRTQNSSIRELAPFMAGLKHADSSLHRSFSSCGYPKNASKIATRERFLRQITIEGSLVNGPKRPAFPSSSAVLLSLCSTLRDRLHRHVRNSPCQNECRSSHLSF